MEGNKQPDNLPDLIEFAEYGGVWPLYLEAIYQYYLDDVANANLTYHGLRIGCKRIPLYEGKGAGFWHAISEGETEETRKADLRRCERIRWIPHIITQAQDGISSPVTWWKNKRGANTHVIFLHEKESYVVILAERNGYYLLKTAYCATQRRLHNLIRERNQFWASRKTKGAH
jgi:hypothetical protein